MKILSIGNSFSQDAQHWLHDMAGADGVEIRAVNLFIGGCSLERHAANLRENSREYDLEINGGPSGGKVSIKEALEAEDWDAVTLQQASRDSGRPQSYVPYLLTLADYVRRTVPRAGLWIHQTWAYEQDSQHDGFLQYHSDQGEMFRRLTDAYEMASRLTGAPLIRVGEAIQALRERTAAFDYAKTGRSLCRDGFHLSLDYGRYAAAAVWYETLTGGDIRQNAFVPRSDGIPADEALLEVIRQTVHQTVGSSAV